jgi:hypothetical protein
MAYLITVFKGYNRQKCSKAWKSRWRCDWPKGRTPQCPQWVAYWVTNSQPCTWRDGVLAAVNINVKVTPCSLVGTRQGFGGIVASIFTAKRYCSTIKLGVTGSAKVLIKLRGATSQRVLNCMHIITVKQKPFCSRQVCTGSRDYTFVYPVVLRDLERNPPWWLVTACSMVGGNRKQDQGLCGSAMFWILKEFRGQLSLVNLNKNEKLCSTAEKVREHPASNLIWGVCILLRVWYRMILGF